MEDFNSAMAAKKSTSRLNTIVVTRNLTRSFGINSAELKEISIKGINYRVMEIYPPRRKNK